MSFAIFEDDQRGEPRRIELDIDRDEEWSLILRVEGTGADDDVRFLSVFTENPAEVKAFFEMVDDARARWNELTR